ncbi:MAG: prepilin-type N-terminal cleavage/methylation domain-containing protein [Merismopedia sp. SIO2A8]|nr:prepilin-type N-terminal cleavage/methylation domain-containing protein [Symploca sp. SIO2B6]NET47756.1 prepilin-type N-terminal cleavage/methylation domain-containing protein [Merismopedia sp. SIO2A8]
MKTDLKAKYIQHLINKKKEDEGFTLIELLVVIIIIGILSAIALPSFLNQANKAKQSEAKTYVGAINRGQQAFYTEKTQFGATVGSLGVGIDAGTVNYTYDTGFGAPTATDDSAQVTSNGVSKAAALRSYVGNVYLLFDGAASETTSAAVMCESPNPGVASAQTGGLADEACPAGWTKL